MTEPPSKTRKGGKRRRTGCVNCRLGHTKCDEQRPLCGRCRRMKLECKVSDFFVSSSWCELLPSTSADGQALANPGSTWDVFNNPLTTLSNLPSPSGPTSVNEEGTYINPEIVELLKEYQAGVGTWMDLFDHSLTYQRAVPRCAHSSRLIMLSLCALTAKQLSLTRRGEVWGNVAVRYYGNSLRLLINTLADPSSSREDAFTATILLSSYELLGSPGLDHRWHVSGALTLIKTNHFTARSQGPARASFWIFVRQDMALALLHECPPMLLPSEWDVCWRERETEEDQLGNRMLWILSKVITFTFQITENRLEENISLARSSLQIELDDWFNHLPPSFVGVSYDCPRPDEFLRQWFAVPTSAAAMNSFHLANLLLRAEGVNQWRSEDPKIQAGIQDHANSIVSICRSNVPDGTLVQAVQPLYFAAKYIAGFAKKAKIWALMEEIETRLGFHTSSRIKKLQKIAGLD